MIIKVRVTPNAGKDTVERVDHSSYRVHVSEKALGGRANGRLVELLSEHFAVSRSSVRITHGAKSGEKTVEIVLD